MPFSNLTFGTPTGCSRTSCDVYVTMAPNTMNSSYLDIYMEGTAAGWVAVGFSDSQAMVRHSDSVQPYLDPALTGEYRCDWL